MGLGNPLMPVAVKERFAGRPALRRASTVGINVVSDTIRGRRRAGALIAVLNATQIVAGIARSRD